MTASFSHLFTKAAFAAGPLALAALAGLAPVAEASQKRTIRPLLPAPVTPLTHKAFSKLLEEYQFIADFEQKPDRPDSADKRFYRYPIPLRAPKFKLRSLTATKEELAEYFSATRGEGRDVEHINIGRNQLRNGRYEQAWHTLMGAKERYGTRSPFHRRIDYFLGYAFINKALELKRQRPEVQTLAHLPPPALRKANPEKIMGLPDEEGKVQAEGSDANQDSSEQKPKKDDKAEKKEKADSAETAKGEGEDKAVPEEEKVDYNTRYDTDLKNASTFLSWAYVNKQDDPDPLVAKAGPPSYYNLAVIYTMRGKWGEAYSAANTGIGFLQRHHDKSYRPELRRIMAEAFLQNRTYWEAITQLDFALRQDPDIAQAAKIFGRAADIYFDLNNFFVAADVYELAIRVNQLAGQVDPNHFVLRGEALFWLKRYKKARIMFQYALSSQYQPRVSTPLRDDLEDLASIRMADTALILGKTKEARQAYFDHAGSHRGNDSATHARLRLICLELPTAKKRNIRHYHDFLAGHKQPLPEKGETFLPPELIKLAHVCETDSFYQRKDGKELLAIIRSFAKKYPQARNLEDYRPKIAGVQRRKIDGYFQRGDTVGALAFFEQNRKTLFAKVPKPLAKKLFFGYVSLHKSAKADEFYHRDYLKSPKTTELLATAMFLAETSPTTRTTRKPKSRDLKRAARVLATSVGPEEPWQEPLTVVRLLTGQGKAHNGGWLLAKALESAKGKPAMLCSRVLPLIAKLSPAQYSSHSGLKQQVTAAVSAKIAAGLSGPDGCFAAALQLESRLDGHRPLAYAKRMLSRKALPVTGQTRSVMLALADRLSKGSLATQKERAETAKKLWQWVSRNGEPVQKKLADLKLNPAKTKTVTESLWQPPK